MSVRTIERVRKRFVEEGLQPALKPKPRPKGLGKLQQAEQNIVELAKSDPPTGRKRWTLRLLSERVVQLEYLESVSHESVRQILKKMA